jgi:hypothetical protein
MRADPRKSVERLDERGTAAGKAGTMSSAACLGGAMASRQVSPPLAGSVAEAVVRSALEVEGNAWLMRILSNALDAPPRMASDLRARMLSASAVRLGECAQLPTWVVTSASVGVATVAAAAGMAATSASIALDAAANLYRLEALQRDMPRYCARHDFHSFSQHG